MGPEKVKIYIVDDHPIVRRGIRQFLGLYDWFTVCGEAEDANKAIADMNSCCPDIAIVDLSLKGVSGIDLIKAITTRYKKIRVLVLSMHDENEYIERAIKAGAMGYIVKSDNEEELVEAIKFIQEGKKYFSTCIRDSLVDKMLGLAPDNEYRVLDSLTNRELDVFRLIGKGLNSKQIAREMNLSASTIGTYRERIKTKLDISSSGELVKYAVKQVLKGDL